MERVGEKCSECDFEWRWLLKKMREEKQEEMSDYLDFIAQDLGGGSLEDGMLVKVAMEKQRLDEKKELRRTMTRWAASLDDVGVTFDTAWLVAGDEVMKWLVYGEVSRVSETAMHWDLGTREWRKSYKGALLDEKELYDYLWETNDLMIPRFMVRGMNLIRCDLQSCRGKGRSGVC